MTHSAPDPVITDRVLHDRSVQADGTLSICVCLVIMATQAYSFTQVVSVMRGELWTLVLPLVALGVVMYALITTRPQRGHTPAMCAQCLSEQQAQVPADLRVAHWMNTPLWARLILIITGGLFLVAPIVCMFELLWGMLLFTVALGGYAYFYRAWREHARWQHACPDCSPGCREWAAARVEYSRALTGGAR